MKFFLLPFIVTSTLAAALSPISRCGTAPPSASSLQQSRLFAAESRSPNFRVSDLITNQRTVDTYFHVLRNGTSPEEGNIPPSQLKAQLKVLNADFRGSGLQFRLAGTTRTTNASWYSADREVEMKTALRRGGYSTLNVYFHFFPDVLGYATVPFPNPDAWDVMIDGASVDFRTVPGGSTLLYNSGRALSHIRERRGRSVSTR